MRKIYTFLIFTFSILSIHSQSTICDNSTPICGNINPTLSTTGAPSIGNIGCLASTPNPNWFVFKVGFTGDISYSLHQGNNAPLYNNSDVDFICWGPFSSIPNCSTQLYDYPDGNTSMPNNIVGCSYSASSTEAFTISGAQSGNYYVILATNFSNTPGFFVLDQTNTAIPGAGSSDCSTICGLYIANQSDSELANSLIFCTETTTSYNIKCNLNTPNSNPITYQWYLNNVLQPALTTQQITVSVSGTWKVVATNPNCNTTEEDSIDITFGTLPTINTATYTVNGPLNDCSPTFDLTNQEVNILNGLNPSEYTIEYFLDEYDSWEGTNPLPNPETFFTTVNTTIYVKVTDNDSPCFENTSFVLDIDCPSTELTITTQPQDQTINSNDTVIFTTNITNATSYQWQMSTDGVNWTTITNGGVNPTFSGANTNTLTINNVPASYNGNMFRVMATSVTDNKISNPANLSIVLSNDSYELSQFSIFPNPTKNNFTLHINKQNLTEDLKYSIYDLNGRKLLDNKIHSLETIIQFEKYQAGIYFIEIITSSGKSTKKLIKQ